MGLVVTVCGKRFSRVKVLEEQVAELVCQIR
jgi:hypothetical protein